MPMPIKRKRRTMQIIAIFMGVYFSSDKGEEQ